MTGFFYRQLAKACQAKTVTPGDQISLKIDLALAHDGSGPAILEAFRSEPRQPAGYCRVLFTLDHAFPAPTVADRTFQLELAKLSARHRFLLFRNGEGVLHQVVAEEESLWPGMIIVGADGHVATAGAFGALAFSVSPKDFVTAVCNGSYILTVPQQIVITLTGRLSPPAMARDLAMHIINRFAPVIQGKAVLLTGPAIDLLTVSEKMALCNFLPEGGVATALVLPQGEQLAHDITIDTQSITPLVCLPGNRLSFTPPANLVEERISVAIVGGCSSGRLDDIKVLAEVLAKNDVHPEVTCLVTPASRNVLAAMDILKLSALLRKAGAIVLPPGCGPCPGKHFGLLSEQDTAITTTIRGNPGRIGAKEARIFLASPLTVAWSAVNGKIATVPGCP